MPEIDFRFDNTYARELEGFYVESTPDPAPSPRWLAFNEPLAAQLGLDPAALRSDRGVAIFSGNELPEGAAPLAQAYAGHQFGGFVPQLGDGRALLLGEVVDGDGDRRDIQLKGSGRTPFSRGGDGKAAVGPVLREFLVSEAMHALGIPTTRALAAVATGETILREDRLPGAVLTRVASSHVRVGTFQFFAARGETDKVKQLADYGIARHYPELKDAAQPYLRFLEAVRDAQAALVARWLHVGFIHGVMNTDNTTISGETIDYGPCAFLDAYAPDTVFSSIDRQGRYAFGQQPMIAVWNLARFAEALLPLIDGDQDGAVKQAESSLTGFMDVHVTRWLEGMRAKLGLTTAEKDDLELANGFLTALEGQNADFTLAFRRLSSAIDGNDDAMRRLMDDSADYEAWAIGWRDRLDRESIASDARAGAMDRVNPIYIPRNHKVEEALEAATRRDDLQPFELLREVLARPYDEREDLETFATPAPASFGPYRTFCGT